MIQTIVFFLMNFVELAVPLAKQWIKNKIVSLKNKGNDEAEKDVAKGTSVLELDFNKDPLNNATVD